MYIAVPPWFQDEETPAALRLPVSLPSNLTSLKDAEGWVDVFLHGWEVYGKMKSQPTLVEILDDLHVKMSEKIVNPRQECHAGK